MDPDHTLEPTATIGRLRVPPLAIGSMYWGTDVAVEDAHALLDRCVDVGATFVDTANNYAFWRDGASGDESETCLGAWFGRRGGKGRDAVVLATKLGARPTRPGADLSDTLGLGRSAVRPQLTDSLRRLRTDHVDLVYAHIDDLSVPLEETLGALGELVDEGLVREIGASNLTGDRLAEAASVGPRRYAALQNRFTYLPVDAGADTAPQVELTADVEAADADITLVGYSPLLSGAYTREDRDAPPEYSHAAGVGAVLSALHRVADDAGLDAGQTVLAWMVSRSRPVLPIVGVSRAEHLDSAVAAVSRGLPAAAAADLDRARQAG